jgi:hypothetical protein
MVTLPVLDESRNFGASLCKALCRKRNSDDHLRHFSAPAGGTPGAPKNQNTGIRKWLNNHNIFFDAERSSNNRELANVKGMATGGHLELITNKRDFDFQFSLYELSAEGDYIQLAPNWSRASYVRDLSHRNLPVAVLSIIKKPGREINYGTGKDVIDESIADAKNPLQIAWFGASYLDLPVNRQSSDDSDKRR